MKKILSFLTLFTSMGTLICCALPALIVGLGMGAAMAGFLSEYPQFIWLSTHKLWLFAVGAIFLSIGGYLHFRKEQPVCPIGEKQEACQDTKKSSRILYILSVGIYSIGFSFAYVIPLFLN